MRSKIDMSDANLGIDKTLTESEKLIIACLREISPAKRDKYYEMITQDGYYEVKRRQNAEARESHQILYATAGALR